VDNCPEGRLAKTRFLSASDHNFWIGAACSERRTRSATSRSWNNRGAKIVCRDASSTRASDIESREESNRVNRIEWRERSRSACNAKRVPRAAPALQFGLAPPNSRKRPARRGRRRTYKALQAKQRVSRFGARGSRAYMTAELERRRSRRV
jgi:hypothetical protein